MELIRVWDLYPEVARRVRVRHIASGLETSAHDFRHAAAVADTAYRIALDQWENETTARLAGLAGLMHNADRVLETEARLPRGTEVAHDAQVTLIRSWLRYKVLELPPKELETIIDAVLKHSGKNDPSDSNVLIALRDADRVVNLRLDDIMRGVRCLLDVPDINHDCYLGSPTATWHEPGSVIQSLLHDTWWAEEWNKNYNMRTRLGWKMAKERAGLIKEFIATLEAQLKEDGLLPNPFAKL